MNPSSSQDLGATLSQRVGQGTPHPIAYASRSLSKAERNYSITKLETLAVVWAITHFHAYLYGNEVTVYTDHSAVRAVLETPSPSGKHARWWTKVYGSGVQIVYRPGKTNKNADALSRSPQAGYTLPECIGESEVQVAQVNSDIEDLLIAEYNPITGTDSFATEQRKDPQIVEVIEFLTTGKLPSDRDSAKKIVSQEPLFSMYYRHTYDNS